MDFGQLFEAIGVELCEVSIPFFVDIGFAGDPLCHLALDIGVDVSGQDGSTVAVFFIGGPDSGEVFVQIRSIEFVADIVEGLFNFGLAGAENDVVMIVTAQGLGEDVGPASKAGLIAWGTFIVGIVIGLIVGIASKDEILIYNQNDRATPADIILTDTSMLAILILTIVTVAATVFSMVTNKK